MTGKRTSEQRSSALLSEDGISARIYEHGSMKPHSHEFVELACIVSGSGVHIVGQERLEICAGDVILIDSGVKHAYEVEEGETLTLCNCLFWPEFLTEAITGEKFIASAYDVLLSACDGEDIDGGYIVVHGGVSEEISELILKIMHEQKRGEAGHLGVMRSLLTVALIRLFRYCAGRRGQTSDEKARLISDVIDYISSRNGKELSVVSISKHAFVSPAYLSRVFRQATGKSIVSYIQTRKLREAARLLLGTDLAVEAVLEKVGYSDKKHFYELFNKAYGMTPGEYRAANGNGKK